MRRIRYIVLSEGSICPKCKGVMERRGHKEIDQKILNQPFYFTEWDYCRTCNHLQHYEEKKVWNDGTQKNALEEIERQENHLFSI